MTSTTFFFIFIPLIAIILLAINLIFAPHNPYQEKDSAFECGFHSFLGQNRTQFSISFFIFALLFLLFDLEILLVYPYVVSAYANGIYGLMVMLIFFLALTLGFAFELGKNALKIDSRQITIKVIHNSSLISHTSAINIEFLKIIFKNLSLRKIVGALFTIIIFTLFKYFYYSNIIVNLSEYWTFFECGIYSIITKFFIQGIVEYIFIDLGFKDILLTFWNGPPKSSQYLYIDNSMNKPITIKPFKMPTHFNMDSDSDRGSMNFPDYVGPPSPGVTDPISYTDVNNNLKSSKEVMEEVKNKMDDYTNYLAEKEGFEVEMDELKNAKKELATNSDEQTPIEDLRKLVKDETGISFDDCEDKTQLLMKLDESLDAAERYIQRADAVISPAKATIKDALDYIDRETTNAENVSPEGTVPKYNTDTIRDKVDNGLGEYSDAMYDPIKSNQISGNEDSRYLPANVDNGEGSSNQYTNLDESNKRKLNSDSDSDNENNNSSIKRQKLDESSKRELDSDNDNNNSSNKRRKV